MILCVVGPTACKKTKTAISLAQHFQGEIISCDSVSVYKDLDIGSAKPSENERSQIKHHLIDVADPFDLSFSVSVYKQMADNAIADCLSRNVLPIVCGGSGLYLDSILHNMDYSCPSSAALRNELALEYDQDPAAFKEQLNTVDPVSANRIPLADKKRLIRAREVYELTGKAFSSLNADYMAAQNEFRYPSIRIGLYMPRQVLYDRIEERVDQMLADGLVEEVERLYKRGLSLDHPSMQSIGYKQLLLYFTGACSLPCAIDEIKKSTRHLAKRQLTWFKRDKGIEWFDCYSNTSYISDIIEYITGKYYDR